MVNGTPAHARIIAAVQNLQDQFGICGLKAPVAIVLSPGELPKLESAIMGSGMLLYQDTASPKTTIWGIEIKETTQA